MAKNIMKNILIILIGPITISLWQYKSGLLTDKFFILVAIVIYLVVPITASLMSFYRYEKFKEGIKKSFLFSWIIYLVIILIIAMFMPQIIAWVIMILPFMIMVILYTFLPILTVSYGIGKIFKESKK